MAIVQFYEKPGCRNNTRQKALLQASGHDVIAHDLLRHPWSAEVLRSFFANQPVAAWFNRAAPRVKDGSLVPETFDEDRALAAMLADPLLIRRPLIEIDGKKTAGFDADLLERWIGLAPDLPKPGEGCVRTDDKSCSGDLMK